MRNLVLMLALSVFTCTVQAADWLSWRRWVTPPSPGPFTVYTSQLLTPDGSYKGLDGDNALIITYARDIDGDDRSRRPATSGRRRAFCNRSRRVKPGCGC